MIAFRLAAAFAVMLLAAAPSFAQSANADPDLPPPDPAGSWRQITGSDALTTSTCIGNPTTPLCAIETRWACLIKVRPELCELVTDERPSQRQMQDPEARETTRRGVIRYRVVYARRPSAEAPIDPKTEGRYPFKPGDVLVGLRQHGCSVMADNSLNCATDPESIPLTVHALRKQGNHWMSVYGFTPKH